MKNFNWERLLVRVELVIQSLPYWFMAILVLVVVGSFLAAVGIAVAKAVM